MLLQQAWQGLTQTHVDLIGIQNGHYVAAGFSDDPGLYFFVPRLAQLFHVSVAHAVDIFLLGGIILGTIIGIIGFWMLFKRYQSTYPLAINCDIISCPSPSIKAAYSIVGIPRPSVRDIFRFLGENK